MDPYPLPAIRRTPRVEYAMYACIRETGGGFSRGVRVRESDTYFLRPTPTLAFANGSMAAPCLVILTVANPYSLLKLLVP